MGSSNLSLIFFSMNGYMCWLNFLNYFLTPFSSRSFIYLVLLRFFHCFIIFRLKRYKNFKEGHSRILVATDLVGRGIDIERVNIVINYDMPDSADTYLHRVLVYYLDLC